MSSHLESTAQVKFGPVGRYPVSAGDAACVLVLCGQLPRLHPPAQQLLLRVNQRCGAGSEQQVHLQVRKHAIKRHSLYGSC